MSSIPQNGDIEAPDCLRPRVMHVPAGHGVVKWMSGDVYETLAPAESTGGALGFTDCWVPPGNGPVAHVHRSADDPVPGARPEFWPPERGLALAPLLERPDVDMLILPEEADLSRPADRA